MQRIFLLSHMRANTSLLGHILGSHPQISGYYEMHLSYLSEKDLVKQEIQFQAKDDIKNTSIYLFDKLLHNDYELKLDKLNDKNIKILVSIRESEQSIKSIVNLFSHKKVIHPYASAEHATEYYINRIKKIAAFCKVNKKNYYYYDANFIRFKSQRLLNQLEHWLLLEKPLTMKYQLFSLTGKTGAGDSSDYIKKGHIICHQTNYQSIKIPSDLLTRAKIETKKHIDYIIEQAIEIVI